MNVARRGAVFGMTGVVAGFLALIFVLVGPSVYDAIYPPPPVEERIADAAVRIKERLVQRLRGAPPAGPEKIRRTHTRELPYTISLALVSIAIVSGCVAYIRREDQRLAYVACGVGTLTLVWHGVLMAMGALILCALLLVVLSYVSGGAGP